MTFRHTFIGRLFMRWGWMTSVRRVPLFGVRAVGKSYFTYTLAHFLAKQGLGHVELAITQRNTRNRVFPLFLVFPKADLHRLSRVELYEMMDDVLALMLARLRDKVQLRIHTVVNLGFASGPADEDYFGKQEGAAIFWQTWSPSPRRCRSKNMTEFARVMTDFQGQPRVEGQIPNTLTSMLATQSFPVNGPVSLEDAADYGGYKIFSFEARLLCFSRFEYKGARDDYDRAIPSARILVIPLETLRYHRDFELLCELVASDLPLEEMAQLLERLDMETTRTQALERLSAKSSYPAGQLAALMADLCTRRRLVIAGNNAAARTNLFGLLFLILPVEVIAQMTWCTYGDFLSENQESLLGSAQKVVTPSGLWSKLGARLLGTKGQIPLVDAANGSLSLHSHSTANRRFGRNSSRGCSRTGGEVHHPNPNPTRCTKICFPTILTNAQWI